MEIGKVISMIRKNKGLSQADLSEMTGLTQASLSHIESGNKKPHKNNIIKICESLCIPIEYFNILLMDNDAKGHNEIINAILSHVSPGIVKTGTTFMRFESHEDFNNRIFK